MVSGDADGKLTAWDWKTTRIFTRFKAHDSVCISCLWLPHETSKVITCGWDAAIKLWDWTTTVAPCVICTPSPWLRFGMQFFLVYNTLCVSNNIKPLLWRMLLFVRVFQYNCWSVIQFYELSKEIIRVYVHATRACMNNSFVCQK